MKVSQMSQVPLAHNGTRLAQVRRIPLVQPQAADTRHLTIMALTWPGQLEIITPRW